MKCPFCGHMEDKVIDSRPAEDGSAIRRRRECLSCSSRFTTYEKVELLPLLVIKKDGTREVYSQEKLLGGLMKACEKRPVSSEQLAQIVSYVENQIQNTAKREISTNEIGEMVMLQLKEIDEVAYVRFASVYRQFKDVNSFMEELQDMLKK
ncbi:MAG: transcriptional repressor NrdR [Clostridiales bacterium]|nr:transcriptional repressor NrdR [Clostridiales bacterium]MBR5416535.1 transcriptional repressor NrdR [Clostridiales bacterium]